jgi:hypothetical protein
MYVKALGILLLLSGLIFGLWKLYDAGGDARETEVRLEFEKERAEMFEQIAEARSKAETVIADKRPVWNDRKEKAREIIVDCTLPDVHIGVLRESGVFKAVEVRDTVNH